MVNYQNTKIYRIVNPEYKRFYIGSTVQPLYKRFYKHKINSKKDKPCKFHKFVLDNGGWDGWKIVLIEEYPCENANQKRRREQIHIDRYEYLLNSDRAFVPECIHNKQKAYCKECKGSGICIHNKQKASCKECKGSGICKHNKQKTTCKECKGSSICIHNKRKAICKECKGSGICIHDNYKQQCKECKGSSICIHNKQKAFCKECNPVYCDVCNSIYSKGSYKKHIKTKLHTNKLNLLFNYEIIM